MSLGHCNSSFIASAPTLKSEEWNETDCGGVVRPTWGRGWEREYMWTWNVTVSVAAWIGVAHLVVAKLARV